MRMRKKKHLDERLEACGDYFIKVMSDDLNFETAIENLYVGGDGAGITRGLAQAGANGVKIAREIIGKAH